MPYQIAFEASKESERELKEKGFEKREVWIKSYSGEETSSMNVCGQGDADFRKMKHPPYQFVTTSWWGQGVD